MWLRFIRRLVGGGGRRGRGAKGNRLVDSTAGSRSGRRSSGMSVWWPRFEFRPTGNKTDVRLMAPSSRRGKVFSNANLVKCSADKKMYSLIHPKLKYIHQRGYLYRWCFIERLIENI